MPARPSFADRLAAGYAWGAGAAFAGSLAYFGYVYLFRFGRPSHERVSARTTLRALGRNLLLFGAFALHHSLLARTGARRRLTRLIPASLERATYVWIASSLFFATCRGWSPLPGRVYALRGRTAWAGHGFQAFGVWLIARSSGRLDVLDLAGIRQVQESRTAPGFATPARPLVATGLYGVVRHPLYLGWMLLVFGAPSMTVTRFAFAAVSTAYLLVALHWEERTLREIFGEDYAVYARRVPWRIVPGLY